ncbi:hypothetical protein HZA56_19515 [Candidatus Poribacteria bacterium]|nr:hypothetical protein [Candidatus Poribacteria bacterium]
MTARVPKVNLEHQANGGILRYLRSGSKGHSQPSAAPEDIQNPYYDLGTHPEIVARIWDEITVKLTTDCRCVVYGAPALVHPESGIIFGFAGGTQTYALRLPEPERREAIRKGAEQVHTYMDGSKLDLKDFGKEWVFGGWFDIEAEWCLAAYEFAGNP